MVVVEVVVEVVVLVGMLPELSMNATCQDDVE